MVKSAECPMRMAWAMFFGEHGLAEALGSDQDHVRAAGGGVQSEEAFEGRSVEADGAVPVGVGDGLKGVRRARVRRRSTVRRCRSSSSAATMCSNSTAGLHGLVS